jgi:hypothetical protein
MATRMQQRRGTAAQWTSADPILNAGEIGWESDTNKFKIGDGTNHWDDLVYYVNGSVIVTAINDLVGTAPATLNTISEIAAAIGDNPNFLDDLATITYVDGEVTTLENQINAKVDKGQYDAKGDLIVGASNDTPARLSVGTNGYLLTANSEATNGVEWAAAPVSLPSQTGNDGKFLTTDGEDASWATLDLSAKQDVVANVSSTEIGYLDGVTSAIQTQLNAKALDSDLTTLEGVVDGKLDLAGGTMTGKITLDGDPSSSLHAATKQYVDNTASGIVAKPQVLGATTANIDATYSNGTAGVGATLTHNTNGVFPAEAGGASGWAVGKGILVKNQTNKAQNGRYYISDMGSVSTPYVLTRCTYCDEASEIPGAYIFVQDGTFAGTGWIQVVENPATFTVGTDDIDVFQFSGSGTITAGTGISVSGNQVSINTATTVDLSTAQSLSNKTIVAPRVQLTMNAQTGTGYTLAIADASNRWVTMDNSSAITVTVPPSVYSVGDQINVQTIGTGQVTFAQGAGVTITSAAGSSSAPKIRSRYGSATVICVGSNSFTIVGDLI